MPLASLNFSKEREILILGTEGNVHELKWGAKMLRGDRRNGRLFGFEEKGLLFDGVAFWLPETAAVSNTN